MDVNSPVSNARSQKLSEIRKLDKGRNRISNLPDWILVHILSFLETEDSVKTSILSKRWQNLWMSVPNLEFYDENVCKREFLMNFVERVLMLRDPSNIQKFTLSCSVLGDASRINTWISAAVKHKVQALDLCLYEAFESLVSLPSSLFTCESLTELKLFSYVDCILKLPSIICFSSLKIMTLGHVRIWDDHLTRRLFSGCPVLEKLTFDQCDWWLGKSVCISAPMLRSLAIFETPGDDYNCEVVINGTSLKSFNYRGELENDYCLCNSSSLVDACINVYESDYEEPGRQRKVVERTHKLLRGLHNARKLILSYETFEVLNYTEELLAHLPMFSNLTFLQLTTGSVNFACGALMKLLRNSPSLNTMEYLEGVCLELDNGKDDWILDPVPSCFSTHLKSIIIASFVGTEGELHAVKILLEYAVVLERIVIHFDEYFFKGATEKCKEVQEQLLLLSRGSNSSQMVFTSF